MGELQLPNPKIGTDPVSGPHQQHGFLLFAQLADGHNLYAARSPLSRLRFNGADSDGGEDNQVIVRRHGVMDLVLDEKAITAQGKCYLLAGEDAPNGARVEVGVETSNPVEAKQARNDPVMANFLAPGTAVYAGGVVVSGVTCVAVWVFGVRTGLGPPATAELQDLH